MIPKITYGTIICEGNIKTSSFSRHLKDYKKTRLKKYIFRVQVNPPFLPD